MTALADYDTASGVDTQLVITDEVLGTCLWCGHFLIYAKPATPNQGMTDLRDFYRRPNISNDYSLLDFPLDYGKYCPFAPPHPLGMYRIHQLVANTNQP